MLFAIATDSVLTMTQPTINSSLTGKDKHTLKPIMRRDPWSNGKRKGAYLFKREVHRKGEALSKNCDEFMKASSGTLLGCVHCKKRLVWVKTDGRSKLYPATLVGEVWVQMPLGRWGKRQHWVYDPTDAPDWVCDPDKKDPFGTPKEKW